MVALIRPKYEDKMFFPGHKVKNRILYTHNIEGFNLTDEGDCVFDPFGTHPELTYNLEKHHITIASDGVILFTNDPKWMEQ